MHETVPYGEGNAVHLDNAGVETVRGAVRRRRVRGRGLVEREERRLIDLLVLRHEVHKVLVDRPIQEHQGIDVQAEQEKVMLEGWTFRRAHGFAVEWGEIEEMN